MNTRSEILKERGRIAREIHDGLAQDLAGINLVLANIASHPESPINIRHQARESREVLRRTLIDLRRQMSGLSSQLDFFESLKTLEELSPDLITVTHSGPPPSTEISWDLFSIIREAVRNALTHSKSTNIKIVYTHNKSNILIHIEQNHPWINTESNSLKFGQLSMKERASEIGFLIETLEVGKLILIKQGISHE